MLEQKNETHRVKITLHRKVKDISVKDAAFEDIVGVDVLQWKIKHKMLQIILVAQ